MIPAIDDLHPILHLREHFRPDHPARLVGGWNVDRDVVGAGVYLVEVLDEADAQLSRALSCDVGVVAQDRHAECQRALCHLGADPSKADHPDHLAGELCAHEALAVPLARLQRATGRVDVAREGQEERHGMFGRREGVAPGGVHHDDPPARGRRDVHVVHSHPRTDDDFEFRRRLQDLGRHLGAAADDHPVGLRQVGAKRRRLEARRIVHLQALTPAQFLDRFLGNAVRNQDLHPGFSVPGTIKRTLRLRGEGRRVGFGTLFCTVGFQCWREGKGPFAESVQGARPAVSPGD